MGQPGLPGLRGVDHIGFTVPDLDEATRFLVDVLGCEYLYSLGPFEHHDDDWMLEHLNVHPRATVPENRFFRCGGQAIFEVFAYTAPERNLQSPRNSDVGGHHVALYVEDLDAAAQHLREAGVNVLGEPTASSGAHLGQRWVYFLSPWGMQFELVSYPQGKAWFNDADSADLAVPASPAALASPADPASPAALASPASPADPTVLAVAAELS